MAQAASRIVTMLPSTPQVESVYLDESQGILSGLLSLPPDTQALPSPEPSLSISDIASPPSSAPASPPSGSASPSQPKSADPHTILIDQTTLDPTAAMAVASRIHEQTGGMALMLDAPVSGGMYALTGSRTQLAKGCRADPQAL